ncbi:iron chelate uptake ABC transporter family permease subunit, partial [Stutzerimonas nitrititolerans]
MARLITPLLGGLLLIVALLSLSLGSTSVNMVGGLLDWLRGADTLEAIVIGDIRLPRTLLAICVGAALGLSGAALQGLLRNPLADPGLIGASQ